MISGVFQTPSSEKSSYGRLRDRPQDVERGQYVTNFCCLRRCEVLRFLSLKSSFVLQLPDPAHVPDLSQPISSLLTVLQRHSSCSQKPRHILSLLPDTLSLQNSTLHLLIASSGRMYLASKVDPKSFSTPSINFIYFITLSLPKNIFFIVPSYFLVPLTKMSTP